MASGRAIRVVLAGLPSMMAAIIREAVHNAGMEVVEVADYSEAVRLALEGHGADVVIVPTARTELTEAQGRMLRANPNLKVLTISASAHSADLFELRLLGADVGRSGIVEAIREVIHER